MRHTPVRAFRSGDTVTIGLNFGRQSDWYQNIKAAGTCRIRMSGGRHGKQEDGEVCCLSYAVVLHFVPQVHSERVTPTFRGRLR